MTQEQGMAAHSTVSGVVAVAQSVQQLAKRVEWGPERFVQVETNLVESGRRHLPNIVVWYHFQSLQ